MTSKLNLTKQETQRFSSAYLVGIPGVPASVNISYGRPVMQMCDTKYRRSYLCLEFAQSFTGEWTSGWEELEGKCLCDIALSPDRTHWRSAQTRLDFRCATKLSCCLKSLVQKHSIKELREDILDLHLFKVLLIMNIRQRLLAHVFVSPFLVARQAEFCVFIRASRGCGITQLFSTALP